MSDANKGKGRASGPGFLGDDDLLAELDAWDRTFDALHEEDTSASVVPVPATAEPGTDAQARAGTPVLSAHEDDRAERTGDEDNNDTLDRGHPRDPLGDLGVGDETDFSELAPGAAPSALGEMLGRAGPPTTVREVSPADPDDAATRMRLGAAPIEDPFDEEVFQDENVYTSASRPLPAPPPPGGDPDFDEGKARQAAPPSPSERTKRTTPFGGAGDFGDAPTRMTTLDEQLLQHSRRDSTPVPRDPARTGPAVVRRDRGREDRATPAGGIPYITDDGATKIANMAELEAQAQANAQQFFADLDEAPAVTLEADESAYDDLELDQGGPAPATTEDLGSAAVERRTTAHLVRRSLPPTKPPPHGEAAPVIEIEAEDDDPSLQVTGERPTPRPGGEDDFSEVADAIRSRPGVTLPATVLDATAPSLAPAPPPGPATAPTLLALDDVATTDEQDLLEPARLPPVLDRDDRARTQPSTPALPASDIVSARVKTPTSVPPLGAPTPTPPATPEPALLQRPTPRPSSGTGPVPLPRGVVSARVKTPTSVPPLGGADPAMTLVGMLPPQPAPGKVAGEAAPTELTPGANAYDGPEPGLELDALRLPEKADPSAAETDEQAAAHLLIYERELDTTDDSTAAAALRVESGRLCERLGDPERARVHYEAALIADPRSTAALRGLRRLARAAADLGEATRHLDAELTIAGSQERRPLALQRIDLLMATGEQDLARVAVGEVLDEVPNDVRGLLANLELAFLDGRADEFGDSLTRLGDAIGDPGLRAVALVARGHLGERAAQREPHIARDHRTAALDAFTAALDADPRAEVAAIGIARVAAVRGDHAAAGAALGGMAARLVETSPATAAAIALRAASRATDPAVRRAAVDTALAARPSSPVVAAAAADVAATSGGDADTVGAARAGAYRHLASTEARPGVRGFAAAMAAELTPALVDALALWQVAVAADPGDDYAVAQLRAAHIAGDDTGAALDFDRRLVTVDASRERIVVRAAYGLAARNEVDVALGLIDASGAGAVRSPALIDARSDILAASGRWEERARALAAVAEGGGDAIDRPLVLIRAARAWDDAAAAAADPAAPNAAVENVTRTAIAALDAWGRVLDEDPADSEAHGAAVALAERLGDRDILFDALTRAQTAERSPARALAYALRRARAAAAHGEGDLGRAEEVLRDASGIGGSLSSTYGAGDPRRIAATITLAARTGRIVEAATAIEERAEVAAEAGRKAEAAALRYRAGQLWLSPVEDAGRAAQLLTAAVADFPQLAAAQDLLATARRKSGDAILSPAPVKRDAEAGTDAFARLVREAELSAERGDGAAATLLLGRALELRPGDPLAQDPMVRLARQAGQAGPVSQVALSALRAAEELGDPVARADAYEQLARIDAEMRGDPASALISWEAALESDPKRYSVLRQLERAYLASERWGDLARLRGLEIANGDTDTERGLADAVALSLDRALLGERHGHGDDQLAALFRAVVERDPASRLGLFHLESLVRRQGSTAELADLEEKIAAWFADDADAQAAFLTRAGETLSDLGQLDAAIDRFRRATDRVPGHAPALQGWRAAALKGELWIDVADAAIREAEATTDDQTRAGLYHLAGVALMDRALVGERAMVALHKALAADPRHQDAFVRLRILLEEDGNHDDLATLLSQRLDVETDPRYRIELHRAVAELHRNFLDDRDTAKRHYRAILEADPNDLRAIAAVSDICFEQGQWAEAAEALMARAKLEADPNILKNLFFRLGLIYADRIPDAPVAIKAFQRVLSYAPDDENALDRLADLAMANGEWKMALGACERLVKAEVDPDRRVRHLHRVARIFAEGMDDKKRAERALNLALDGAPASDAALAELIKFYQDAGDTTSTRVHLNRVAGAMRVRIAENPRDGVAARVLSRAMMARHHAGVHGSRALALAGAELALVVGAAGEPERALTEADSRIDLAGLLRPESDEILYPRTVPRELRQLLALLGERIAKHVGVDLRPYGATRGDRLRAKDSLIAAAAQDLAAGLGLGEIDVYLSTRQPWAMVAEPTSPVSLVLGAELARGEVDDVRFGAGGALKLAQSAMAIPFRLAVDELGALVIGLLRLFQPDFPALFLEPDAVTAQSHKLKRLIPSGLMNELRPYALAIDGNTFDHRQMAAGVRAAAYRAGLVTGGSLAAGLRILAGRAATDLAGILDDPEARDLIAFALGEDHAHLAGG